MRTLIRFLLLLVLLLPASAAASTFLVATDIHYLSPALTDYGAYFTRMMDSADGKVTRYVSELTDAFVCQVIEKAPDCLIISGDITFNGAKKSHEDVADKLRIIDSAGIPVYVIPGNHDLNCYSAASFFGDSFSLVERVDAAQFEAIYRDLGYDEAIDRDPHSLSYMAEPVPGIRILMLDTNTLLVPCAVAQNTFAWLENALARAQADNARVIAVSHQNLYAHSSLLYVGYVISNASMLEGLYARYGVSVNLSGHMHMQHMLDDQAGPPEIVTSSLCVSPCQYGVIETDGSQAAYHTETVNVEAWAKENGIDDPNLLRFSEYVHAFMIDLSIRKTAAGDPAPDEAAVRMAEINAAYFAGRMDTIDAGLIQTADIAAENTFTSLYLKSMLEEIGQDHTRMTFPL